jgi:hypothetical protein
VLSCGSFSREKHVRRSLEKSQLPVTNVANSYSVQDMPQCLILNFRGYAHFGSQQSAPFRKVSRGKLSVVVSSIRSFVVVDILNGALESEGRFGGCSLFYGKSATVNAAQDMLHGQSLVRAWSESVVICILTRFELRRMET